MDDKKISKSAITWSEMRNFIYFGTVLVTVVLYINNISTKIDLANQRLDTVNARLINHGDKLAALATSSELANDRLTKIETTLEINQEEGRISDGIVKPKPQQIELAFATKQQVAMPSASITPLPAAANTTTNNIQNTYIYPTETPEPTAQQKPQPTAVPQQPLQGIKSGVGTLLGL